MMKQVVLDGDVLVQACGKGQRLAAIQKLFDLAGKKAITLWVHPYTVTDSLVRLQAQPTANAAQRMAEILEIVQLLPAPGVQLKQALLQLAAQDGKQPFPDIVFLLSVIAAREYLGKFIFVGPEADRDFPGTRVLSPEECVALLDEEPVAEQTVFVDLSAQQHEIYPALEANIFQVIKNCRFVLGPEVEELETRLADYVQSEHAITCSSGTEALVLALMALDIGPGDAVFTTPFTFIATAGAVCQLGATPVFVDIDPRTFNLDPDKFEAAVVALAAGDTAYPLPKGAAGLKPRAVITVDLFGLPADHHRISAVAARHGLVVIEDAAQSFGGEERGRKACALAEIGCTSFFPAKPLGGYGEGGACFTNNAALAEAMRSIRVHGQGASRYEHTRLGTNARLDSLQAAVLLAKMDVFPVELKRRTALAMTYSRLLAKGTSLETPHIPAGFSSAWAQYSLLAKNEAHRNACQQALSDEGIPSMVYYPIPLHLQRVFVSHGYGAGDFSTAEQTSRNIFSLPMHPYLDFKTQERIAAILRRVDIPA